MTIERAVPADAEAMLKIKQAAWLDIYPNDEHGVTREDIYKKFTDEDVKSGALHWQKAIAAESEDDERISFVAKIDGKVVGFTSPGLKDGKRMLGAMFVVPGAQHKGVGTALIKQALDWLGDQHDIFLDVVGYNERAIKFYEHYGFKKTGVELPEEIDEQGLKLLHEIEMVRRTKS